IPVGRGRNDYLCRWWKSGLPDIGKPTEKLVRQLVAADALELHLVEALGQGAGVLVVAGLARIVRAQRHAAHAGQLLGRNLGILLALELVPEALVRLAAI